MGKEPRLAQQLNCRQDRRHYRGQRRPAAVAASQQLDDGHGLEGRLHGRQPVQGGHIIGNGEMGRGFERRHQHGQDGGQPLRREDRGRAGHPGQDRRHRHPEHDGQHRDLRQHRSVEADNRHRVADVLPEGLRLQQRSCTGRGHLEPRDFARGVLYRRLRGLAQRGISHDEEMDAPGIERQGGRLLGRHEVRGQEESLWRRQCQQRAVPRTGVLLRPHERQGDVEPPRVHRG